MLMVKCAFSIVKQYAWALLINKRMRNINIKVQNLLSYMPRVFT